MILTRICRLGRNGEIQMKDWRREVVRIATSSNQTPYLFFLEVSFASRMSERAKEVIFICQFFLQATDPYTPPIFPIVPRISYIHNISNTLNYTSRYKYGIFRPTSPDVSEYEKYWLMMRVHPNFLHVHPLP